MTGQQLLPHVSPSPSPEEEELREARRAERMFRRKQQRRARLSLWATIGTTVLLLAFIGFFYLQIQSTLARAQYPPISGVSCDSMEQNAYHIHVHFTIYINGKLLNIPAGIGIAPDGSCFYWMHTHAEDGILHIEAPAKVHNLALDDFITIWQEGFSKLNFPPQMLDSTGWQIWVNGTPFDGVVTSPLHTEVQFHSHDAVTLEYGSPNPPPDKFYAFPPNLPQ
jgi:hypothetical protein